MQEFLPGTQLANVHVLRKKLFLNSILGYNEGNTFFTYGLSVTVNSYRMF